MSLLDTYEHIILSKHVAIYWEKIFRTFIEISMVLFGFICLKRQQTHFRQIVSFQQKAYLSVRFKKQVFIQKFFHKILLFPNHVYPQSRYVNSPALSECHPHFEALTRMKFKLHFTRITNVSPAFCNFQVKKYPPPSKKKDTKKQKQSFI